MKGGSLKLKNKSEKKPVWHYKDPKERTKSLLIWAIGFGILIWGSSILNFHFARLFKAWFPLSNFFGRLLPPDLSYIPKNVIWPLIETIQMSVLGTILGIFLAIPVAWLAAYNISPLKPFSYILGRGITVVTRSIHVFIWSMILVALLGFGPLPGILALGIYSVGFLGKMWAEEIENIDHGQVEAIEATGANRFQIIFYGVLPQIFPSFVGLSIYRWDINLRASSVLGMVGAGGLGYELNRTINLLAYKKTASVLFVIIIIVIITEFLSAYIRGKIS